MKNYSHALSKLVNRIVEEIKPLRVILFGSVARNSMGEDSDIDLLVVMPEGTHRRHTAQFLYKNVRNIGVPFDILVVTNGDLEKYKNSAGLIYQEILAEGGHHPDIAPAHRGYGAQIAHNQKGTCRANLRQLGHIHLVVLI